MYISHQTDIQSISYIYIMYDLKRFRYNLIDSYTELRKMNVSRDNLDILFALLNEDLISRASSKCPKEMQ